MSKQQAWILIVIAAAAVGALVQMNRYRYFEQTLGQAASAYILRIDRLTGARFSWHRTATTSKVVYGQRLISSGRTRG